MAVKLAWRTILQAAFTQDCYRRLYVEPCVHAGEVIEIHLNLKIKDILLCRHISLFKVSLIRGRSLLVMCFTLHGVLEGLGVFKALGA
jgi:hypothetical protein